MGAKSCLVSSGPLSRPQGIGMGGGLGGPEASGLCVREVIPVTVDLSLSRKEETERENCISRKEQYLAMLHDLSPAPSALRITFSGLIRRSRINRQASSTHAGMKVRHHACKSKAKNSKHSGQS